MMLSSRCNQSQPLPQDLLLQPQHEDSSTLDKSATRSAKIFLFFRKSVMLLGYSEGGDGASGDTRLDGCLKSVTGACGLELM